MRKVNLAIVGATGLVGRTFIQVLEERNFPIENIYFFASKRSEGRIIKFKGLEYEVEELTVESFNRPLDIALFSAGSDVSKKFAPIAKDHGVVVIDNSNAWRMDPDVPLIVPEVNPEDIRWHRGIIANPNCSTIQCVVPLKVLHAAYRIKRIIYSTYQAVSGSGMGGLTDLANGLTGQDPKKYPHPIAFNCLPHIDVFLENGYTKEENKMIEETKKILHDQHLRLTATAVRVPVRYGHSVSINIEFDNPFELEEVYRLLRNKDGLIVQDDGSHDFYPMPINAAGTDEVYVGRIRRDFSVDHGLNIWVVADNIRKGAATNAVQIAELLLKGE